MYMKRLRSALVVLPMLMLCSVAWGADVYYSVGQNTDDHKTGSPTLSISAGTGTFLVEQTAANMGVGDKVTYNMDSVAFISGKISATQWSLITPTGGMPADVTDAAVDSIAHAFSSLQAAVGGASPGAAGAGYLNTTDLVTGGYVLHIPCYYDSGADTTAVSMSGWTTGPGNYIKVYAPNNTETEVNQSQRHAGRWNDTAYRLEFTGTGYLLDCTVGNSIFEGLQAYKINAPTALTSLFTAQAANITFDSCIAKGPGAPGWVSYNSQHLAGFYAYGSFSGPVYYKNCVSYNFYDATPSSTRGFGFSVHDISASPYTIGVYYYNCSAVNCRIGFNNYTYASAIFKNCLAQDGSNGWYKLLSAADNATSTNNCSDISGDAPGAHARTGDVSFADAANDDFHLASDDAGARDYGADLSADAAMPFSIDIDNQTRFGSWDIGADEYGGPTSTTTTIAWGTAVYYSAGQNTDDHKTGSPTLSISAGTGTFSVEQTAANMGVGDKVTYNTDSVAFISGKISATQWSLITATGEMPADVTDAAVDSIAHAFSSLQAAVGGASPGATGAGYLNTADLVTGGYALHIPCYYDTGADTTAVSISGWITGPGNYIKIYAPNNAETEVNQSQRHAGMWSDAAYKLELEGVGYLIDCTVGNIIFEGLQAYKPNAPTALTSLFTAQAANITFDSCIAKGPGRIPFSQHLAGFYICSTFKGSVHHKNCLSYDFYSAGTARGYGFSMNNGNAGAVYYNCSAINCRIGFNNHYVLFSLFKNCLAQANDNGWLSSSTPSESTNNCSDINDDAPGAYARTAEVSFADAANADFHLASDDAGARDYGADLSADAAMPFSIDIDAQIRSGTWDIGPDEFIDDTGGVDTDADGMEDLVDNCPNTCNPLQLDADNDGIGDVCDPAPGCGGCGQPACEPTQADTDNDGIEDACDECPVDPLKTVAGVCGCGVADTDSDGDGTADCADNCPNICNSQQLDADGDGTGDVCDATPGCGGCGTPVCEQTCTL